MFKSSISRISQYGLVAFFVFMICLFVSLTMSAILGTIFLLFATFVNQLLRASGIHVFETLILFAGDHPIISIFVFIAPIFFLVFADGWKMFTRYIHRDLKGL